MTLGEAMDRLDALHGAQCACCRGEVLRLLTDIYETGVTQGRRELRHCVLPHSPDAHETEYQNVKVERDRLLAALTAARAALEKIRTLPWTELDSARRIAHAALNPPPQAAP